MFKAKVLLAAAVAGLSLLTAGHASAIVTLGFEINSIGDAPLFEYRTGGTAAVTNDTLHADNTVQFTVSVDGTPVPAFAGATFQFDADLVNLQRTSSFYVLTFAGQFALYDGEASAENLIVSAQFDEAQMLLLRSGTRISFGLGMSQMVGEGDSPLYTVGPALQPFLPADMFLGGDQTMNFTIEELASWAGQYSGTDPITTGAVFISGTDMISGMIASNFIFDSSFSGTSDLLVPEPATLAMLLGGVGGLVRRRVTAGKY